MQIVFAIALDKDYVVTASKHIAQSNVGTHDGTTTSKVVYNHMQTPT